MRRLSSLLLLLVFPIHPLSQQSRSSECGLLVFTHVTVIDMTGASPKPDMTVVINGNRISALGRSGRVRIPRGSQVVDATGKFLIPGLWDMHVHIKETERSLPMFVANGVTGVRNTGGIADNLFRWRAEIASGKLLGPRIVACGPVVEGEDASHPDHNVVVRNAAEARASVISLKHRGADFIRFMTACRGTHISRSPRKRVGSTFRLSGMCQLP